MRGSRGLLAFGIAVAALLLAGPASATFPGKNGFVVFSSDRDGDPDLFAQNLDGSALRKLVDRPGTDEFNPSWSPSGKRLVFQTGPTDDFDLYLVNANGKGLAPLLVGATSDARGQFCDEDTVVFQRHDSAGMGDIYAIETNGTGLRRLTDGPANDSSPTCSPDGTKVAFSSTRNGVQGIYEVTLASAQAARTPQLAEPTLLAASAVDPDYSPDGRTLAYAARDKDNVEIFARILATGAVAQITFTAAPLSNRLPKFYPAGSSGLASRSPAGPPSDLPSHTRINADGTHDLCLDPSCAILIANADAGATQPRPSCSCQSLTIDVEKQDVRAFTVKRLGVKTGRRLYFILDWRLRCTVGQGRCQGTLEFEPPKRYKVLEINELVKSDKRKKIPAKTRVFGCSGSCEKTTVGSLEFLLKAPALFGSQINVRFVTRCEGEEVVNFVGIDLKGGKIVAVSVFQPLPLPDIPEGNDEDEDD